MLSLKTDVISIRNTQLIRCYNILALQHCSLIKTGHQCSKWGLQGASVINLFCRQEVCRSNEVKTKV